MSRHKEAYVISYHEALCHDMSYVMTIVASLIWRSIKAIYYEQCIQYGDYIHIMMHMCDQACEKGSYSLSK